MQQLLSASCRRLHIDDLQHNHRLVSADHDEYASLTSWMDAAEPSSAEEMVSVDHTSTPTQLLAASTPKELQAQLVLG